MSTLVQDLRFGLRMLAKNPGFTVVAILTLALGIGANTAIFSVVYAVLIRPLPYKDPTRLVAVWERDQVNSNNPSGELAPAAATFLDWRSQNKVFEDMAAFDSYSTRYNLTGGDRPEQVVGVAVSANLFHLLGINPIVGGTFFPEEQKPGRDRVVLLSYDLWRRYFGADRSLVGKVVSLNNQSYTVLGIMPQGFNFPGDAGGSMGSFNKPAELWIPLALDPAIWSQRYAHYLQAIARLKLGVKIEQAQSEMDTLQYPIKQRYRNGVVGSQVTLVPLQTQAVGAIRRVLLVLWGVVAFVLLIACVNVANIMLARVAVRQSEMAIRTALGASRSRTIRQLLTESLLLTLLGGTFGTLLAWWGMGMVKAISPHDIPQIQNAQIDIGVLSFTLVVSVLIAAICGLIPALQASRPNLIDSLKEGGRSGSEGVARNRLRGMLVTGEIALTLILLVGAGLTIQSLWRLQKVDPGFRPEHLLTLEISLPNAKYPQKQQQAAFFHELSGRITTLPGVNSAGTITAFPLTGSRYDYGFVIEGHPASDSAEKFHVAGYRAVSPDYFRTLGIPLLKGRTFTERDTNHSSPVLIINQTMARRFFPNENPLGMRVVIGDGGRTDPSQIVGVVGDVKHNGLSAEPGPEMYEPYLQVPWPTMTVAVRTSANPINIAATVRSEVRAIDKDQPISHVKTMDEILADNVVEPRFRTLLLSLFGAIALMLTAVGVYGVISYSVNQRAKKIGLRMALGARQGDVLVMVLGEGLRLAAAGVLIGLAGALALTRVLASILYSVRPTDPFTFAASAAVLILLALLACYIPARQATRIDPMAALRGE